MAKKDKTQTIVKLSHISFFSLFFFLLIDSALLKYRELRLLFQWELVQTLTILLGLIDIHSAKNESITYASMSDSQSTWGGDLQLFSTRPLARKKDNEVANLVKKNEFFPWQLFFCIASMVH